MSKLPAKQTALQKSLAREGGRKNLALLNVRFLQLVGATALIVVGLFLSWQAWLTFRESNGATTAEEVRNWEVHALSEKVSQTRTRLLQAINNDDVADALGKSSDVTHSAAAVTLIKKALPETVVIEFYRPDVSDVMSSDFAEFGYAKAALLVQAHQLHRMAPLQSFGGANKPRVLVTALPVMHENETLAYAYVEIPFDLIRKTFREPFMTGAARVDLRQGDGRGDLLLDSIGDEGGSTIFTDIGVAIPNSAFRIGTQLIELFIPLRWSIWLLVPLALAALAAGFALLYARAVGWQRFVEQTQRRPVTTTGAGPTLAESMADSKAAAAAKPDAASVVKPKTAAKPTEADVSVDASIFRAYDIRGVIGKTLTKGVAREIGRAIGSEARDRGLREIAVARDGRLSGPDLAGALIEGLRSTGCDVIDIGAAPTPVLYFATFHLNTGSGVMVTGSHNPPDYNGFKIVLGGETLAEDAIHALYKRITEKRYSTGSGGLQAMSVNDDYVERIAGDVQLEHTLKVVVDCGNGIPGAIAPLVLQGIGCEVLPLYCDVDGNFPNHHPDPSDPKNLSDLILTVKQMKADLGLAFDGDGDRLGVVTASGEIIYPDRLLMLFAKDVLVRNPGAAIIYDVKCTGKLQPLILQSGGSPIMWRTGHSLIKAKMRETDAELAGEMSGHFFFKERWYGFDDGMYAAARLVEILAGDAEGRTPQEIFDGLPKGVSTPELKIEMVEGEHYRFIERFREKSSFDGAKVTTIDGVRADWPDGWGLVRASNTTPVLVLRFDADSDAALLRIQDVFRKQLLAVDANLKLPF
jgi:phosphomannomutase / phosphoglucomutase